jgi:DNA-binding transcriptional ArsR family regulator
LLDGPSYPAQHSAAPGLSRSNVSNHLACLRGCGLVVTFLSCTYLSGVLLLGLVLNALFGWSWADPVVGLVIAAVAIKEGRTAWRGEHCC